MKKVAAASSCALHMPRSTFLPLRLSRLKCERGSSNRYREVESMRVDDRAVRPLLDEMEAIVEEMSRLMEERNALSDRLGHVGQGKEYQVLAAQCDRAREKFEQDSRDTVRSWNSL